MTTGTSLWQRTKRFDPAVARLADSHYSRQKVGSPQFHPPGQSIVLYVPGPQWPFRAWAGWVWWRPHPDKAKRYDGYDGWFNCSFLGIISLTQCYACDLVVELAQLLWRSFDGIWQSLRCSNKLCGVGVGTIQRACCLLGLFGYWRLSWLQS